MIKMNKTRNNQFGYAIIGLLIVFVIIAILSGQYFKRDTADQVSTYERSMDKSSDAACSVNRQTGDNMVDMWMANHMGETPTIEGLRAAGNNIPTCPGTGKYHGEYSINEDNQLACSVHGPFAESESENVDDANQEPSQENSVQNQVNNLMKNNP